MKNAVYFFAQYPRDYAMCAGLADILREFRPNLPLILICTTEPNTQGYQWDDVLGRFDQVHHVSSVMHGGFRSAFNLRGIASALIKDFPRARKVVAELRKIEFLSNSIAFVFDGYSLNQSIFLKRVGSDPEIESVLMTEVTDDVVLSDFVVGYSESLYLNFYLHFFGTAYQDLYWMRTGPNTRTSQRECRFRNKPADFVFTGEHALRRSYLKPGQAA